MEVERQIVDLYRALYMRGRIGEQFAGTISSVTPSGVFVQLEEPFVDVLVTMEALGPDSYELDEDGLRIVAARSGERLMLGDAMTVQIEDVSLTRRSVYGRRLRERPPERERPTRGKGRRRS
jgi:ribonuclease R